jgi:glutathione peroxidase
MRFHRHFAPFAVLSLLTFAAGDLMSAEKTPGSPLDFEMKSLSGKDVNLQDYRGKVVLIVNTASKCGATPQYRPLQSLYQKYQGKDFVVLGFPCNQFGAQEPGNAEQIGEFCTKNYGVTFPMFAKIDVNGAHAAPLYQYLTSKQTNPEFAGKIRWNFEKFLIGKDGKILARFDTSTEPDAPQVTQAIEAALAQ